MGSSLDPENIKEGDDVYFECHINANPEVQRVLWYHNGKPLEHRTNRGIIIQNQTLVLQKINRESAGFYTCRAVNMEGEGESQPVELQEAFEGGDLLKYRERRHQARRRYTYPAVSNGRPVRPDPPKNCSIANRTTDTIEVECTAGFDGGLPQTFFMEVYDSSTSALHRNLSSSEPVFVLTSLRPGLAFLMVTYAANSKGRSASFKLETFTLKVAEKRTGPPTLFEFTPVLGVVIGVVLALILMALVIMVVMKMRRPSPGLNGGHGSNEELKGDLENKPLNVGVLGGGPRVKESSSVGESEDNDPDIIPHKTDVMTYQDYESIDRKGPGRGGTNIETVPSVRTIPHTVSYLQRHSNHHFTLQHNQSLRSARASYADLPLPPDAQPGYQVSATDLCLFVAQRRSAYQPLPTDASDASPAPSPSPSSAVASTAAGSLAASPDGGHIYAAVAPIARDAPRPASAHIYAAVDTSPRRALGRVSPQHVPPAPSSSPPADRSSALAPAAGAHLYASLTRPRSSAAHPSMGGSGALAPAPANAVAHNNIYATIDARRSTTTPAASPAALAYVTLGKRGHARSPLDFRDPRTSVRPPVIRTPNESAV
ncbi:uncharacterized protein LOC122247738 [Penaeus japonicus]|uniref:uncharacterized protein LOC122247738 n=1 Tax=Penaeus japonicus TaxID=27405 RepID=UPI001C714BDA|nr:uncharacterized protein LOC122247738 [Penaeus japonicus]